MSRKPSEAQAAVFESAKKLVIQMFWFSAVLRMHTVKRSVGQNITVACHLNKHSEYTVAEKHSVHVGKPSSLRVY